MSVPRDERLSGARVASHLLVMVAVAAVMGVIAAGLAIPFAGVLGVGARQVAEAMDDLPAELQTDPLPQKTKLLDADGNTIATIYDENRVNVALSQVSRIMVKSIVAIEDYRYYEHGALDLKGTLRALITNQANSGVVQGGSSITQQMVKMTLLTQADTKAERRAATDDTYARKLRELRYAIAFEQKYSKDWILERYLNIAYFGDGTYGVQSAARHYFDVNAKELNLRQSAMLAGLVKNPTGYDPTNSPDKALARRNIVLDRMAELNVISREKAAKTKETDLGLDVKAAKNGCLYSRAPFFCDYAVSWLLQNPALGDTVEERRKLLKTGGLTIKTTLDLDDQNAADNAVANHVYKQDQAVGALAMVTPGSGAVTALAQSRPMGRSEAAGQTFLNYTVPTRYGGSAGFQAGSTFKPFVLAAAVNDHIPLSTTLNPPAEMSIPQEEFANCEGEPGFVGTWDVATSTTSGTMDIYRGTQTSSNTFYAMLERETGVCDPYKIAKSLGVDLTNPRGDEHGFGAERVPTFTLGVANASPLEMAEAYATFAARGLHCDSQPVTDIADADGNELKHFLPSCDQALPQATADAVNDVLRGVQEPGGFGYDNGQTGLVVPSAAKTGTTQDGKSVWYVGYTPQLAAAAMIAGASKEGQRPIGLAGQTIGGEYIWEVSGSGFAGPMWAQAMQAVDDSLDDEDFVAPALSAIEGEPTLVPSVSGMSVSEAEAALEAAGFNAIQGGAVASGNPAGTVAYTSPSGGSYVPEGSIITVYTSTGVAPPPDKPDKPDNGGGNGGGPGGGGPGNGGPGNGGPGNGNGPGGGR
ncbi:transglycosylase domain-containing protein [Nocardioides sp. SR21]|uniref:transglycosylase domain-containing protein n=1 Tax=Nocardioides sp. SR21 TaxID=2919501 RepID=UPI001FAA9FD6|nr:transglycosylase domain-containing protein [Nocardioides sp. SR21]